MGMHLDSELIQLVEEKSPELASLLKDDELDVSLRERLLALCDDLIKRERVAVAFSAGVDSAFLLVVAHQLLSDACVAVTARSRLLPESEFREAASFCERRGIRHVVTPFDEMQVEQLGDNVPDRCYWCKLSFMGKVKQIARLVGCPCVVEGSNADDLLDYRPGLRAIRELEIASSLKDVGMTKGDIRELSRAMGLSLWDKPSYACLASRIPYGERVTVEKISMVEAAEAALVERGFRQVRVRAHELSNQKSLLARIELQHDDLPRFADGGLAADVNDALLNAGFSYATVDLGGYETGKLNRGLVE